jgi:hypothetical protein
MKTHIYTSRLSKQRDVRTYRQDEYKSSKHSETHIFTYIKITSHIYDVTTMAGPSADLVVLAKKNAPFVANLIRDDQTICNYFNI